MKVLVTGGTGFVGLALVRHLHAAGYDVRVLVRRKKNRFLLAGLDVEVIDGDVTHPDAVEKAVKGCDVVFDVAAIYTFYPFWEKEAKALYKVNVQGTINLLEAALKYDVKRFIHTSSIATIGKSPKGQLSNEETGFNPKSAGHYARSKYLAEQEVLKYCRKGLSAVILNPAIIIGARDHKPTPSGNVIVRFLNGHYPGYFDTLWAVADVDDVAKAHIAAIERGRVGERYILCNKKHYSLKEIFLILEKISGIKAPRLRIPYLLLLGFVYLDEALSHLVLRKKPLMPTEGVKFCKMSIRYDNSKAVRELGYASTPMEETLTKAVSWYLKNAYVQPRGIFRLKARGSRFVAAVMRKIRMEKLTDKLNLGTLSFFLVVQCLKFLQKIGCRPGEDGWRRVTKAYLRTEHSKFSLAVFGLDYWSDSGEKPDSGFADAKRHLIERLAQFFRHYPDTHYRLRWYPFSAHQEIKKELDFVLAEFDPRGNLKSIEPYLDPEEPGRSPDAMPREWRAALIQAIIKNYNKTRNCRDKKRPLLLKKELDKWCSKPARSMSSAATEQARHFIDRILSAAFISFEKLPSDEFPEDRPRFRAPDFIKLKHPGFGLLNIVARLTADLKEADLWLQFSHIPVDGVPMQEMLNEMKRRWGKSGDIKFPAPGSEPGIVPDLCSTAGGKNGIYHVCQFIDFQPFLKLRRELNKRFSGEAKESITSAALLIWKMAQYNELKDIKFAVPIDLPATERRERTLGFVFIRPHVYFDKEKPDRGFFRFQQEFNQHLRATRKRESESYKLLETYAVTPPVMYTASLKLIPAAMKDFVGSLGITIIKKADFFISPYSDIHTDGFIAFSNFSLPAGDGRKVGVVSIKGPKEKIQKHMRVLNDIMHRAIHHDELYF